MLNVISRDVSKNEPPEHMSKFDRLQFPLSERHGLETAGEAVGDTDGDEVGQIESDKQTPVM